MVLLFLIYYFKMKKQGFKYFLKPLKPFLLKLNRGKREEVSPKIYFRHTKYTIVRSLATRNPNGLSFWSGGLLHYNATACLSSRLLRRAGSGRWWLYVSYSQDWLEILPLLLALWPPLHMLAKTILFYRANWRVLLLSGLKHTSMPEHSSSIWFLVNQSNESTQLFIYF